MTHDSKELARSRNDALETSAQIVLQYDADPAIAFDIRALKSDDVAAPQPGMRAEDAHSQIFNILSEEITQPRAEYLPAHFNNAVTRLTALFALPAASPAAPPKSMSDLEGEAWDRGFQHGVEKGRAAPPKPAPDAMREALEAAREYIGRDNNPKSNRVLNLILAALHSVDLATMPDVPSAPIAAPDGAGEPDFVAAAFALGFRQLPNKKWFHPKRQHFVELYETAEEIFERHWDKSLLSPPPSDDVRSALADGIDLINAAFGELVVGASPHVPDTEKAKFEENFYRPARKWINRAGAALRSALVSAPAVGVTREASKFCTASGESHCASVRVFERCPPCPFRLGEGSAPVRPVPDATVSEPVAWGSADVADATADIWRAYCAETLEEYRSLQGALAFGVAFVLTSPQHGSAAPVSARDAVIEAAESWKYENPKSQTEQSWNDGIDERIRSLTGAKP